jgi:hypothetical protein
LASASRRSIDADRGRNAQALQRAEPGFA